MITACINHCLAPVADGMLCALDSCDLFTGAGLPNAGVCATWSACRRTGGPTSKVGICTPLGANVPGCSITSNAAARNPGDQDECPYGGYCAALGANAGVCGAATSQQNGLPGMCRRYARVGEACSGPDADARQGNPLTVDACAVCEPGARCIALNRFDPRATYAEANGDPQPPQWRCVRTCPSGTDADCDCPGSTPNNEAHASACREGVCSRPQWCAARDAPCGHALLPARCFETPPPVSNDVGCLISCCERGAVCSDEGAQSKCLPCIEDGTTLTSSSRCCLNAFFEPMPGNPSIGKCHGCKGLGQTATAQVQCCPGLRFSPIPGTTPTLGNCVVCRSAGQVAGSVAECCPGLALFPDVNDPTVSVCNTCRATGESALSSAECCLGLSVRLADETGSVPVCAPPCQSCTPLAPGLGRCSRGDPTICPLSGMTLTANCLPNSPITETCLPEDEDCDGARFNIADPTMVLGRPCTMPVLPPGALCSTAGGGNWRPTSFYPAPALTGHLVCDPSSPTPICTAIPGIDYCGVTRNCRVNCAVDGTGTPVMPCVSALRHDDTTPAGARVVVDTVGTATPAVWFGAPIRDVSGTAMSWGTFDEGSGVGCGRLCAGETCSGSGSCTPGLMCASTCMAETCVAPDLPVVCSNHVNGAPSTATLVCRAP